VGTVSTPGSGPPIIEANNDISLADRHGSTSTGGSVSADMALVSISSSSVSGKTRSKNNGLINHNDNSAREDSKSFKNNSNSEEMSSTSVNSVLRSSKERRERGVVGAASEASSSSCEQRAREWAESFSSSCSFSQEKEKNGSSSSRTDISRRVAKSGQNSLSISKGASRSLEIPPFDVQELKIGGGPRDPADPAEQAAADSPPPLRRGESSNSSSQTEEQARTEEDSGISGGAESSRSTRRSRSMSVLPPSEHSHPERRASNLEPQTLQQQHPTVYPAAEPVASTTEEPAVEGFELHDLSHKETSVYEEEFAVGKKAYEEPRTSTTAGFSSNMCRGRASPRGDPLARETRSSSQRNTGGKQAVAGKQRQGKKVKQVSEVMQDLAASLSLTLDRVLKRPPGGAPRKFEGLSEGPEEASYGELEEEMAESLTMEMSTMVSGSSNAGAISDTLIGNSQGEDKPETRSGTANSCSSASPDGAKSGSPYEIVVPNDNIRKKMKDAAEGIGAIGQRKPGGSSGRSSEARKKNNNASTEKSAYSHNSTSKKSGPSSGSLKKRNQIAKLLPPGHSPSQGFLPVLTSLIWDHEPPGMRNPHSLEDDSAMEATYSYSESYYDYEDEDDVSENESYSMCSNFETQPLLVGGGGLLAAKKKKGSGSRRLASSFGIPDSTSFGTTTATGSQNRRKGSFGGSRLRSEGDEKVTAGRILHLLWVWTAVVLTVALGFILFFFWSMCQWEVAVNVAAAGIARNSVSSTHSSGPVGIALSASATDEQQLLQQSPLAGWVGSMGETKLVCGILFLAGCGGGILWCVAALWRVQKEG